MSKPPHVDGEHRDRPIRWRTLSAFVGVWLGLIVVGSLWATTNPSAALGVVLSRPPGTILSAFLVVGGTLCAVVSLILMRRWRRGRDSKPGIAVVGFSLVVVLLVGTVLPFALATGTVWARSTASAVFQPDAPKLQVTDRWNIALFGSDGLDGRATPGIDSISVVSIEMNTGEITLLTLPRAMHQVPLPESSVLRAAFPDGVYDCGGACSLKSLYERGNSQFAPLFERATPDGSSPGIEALRSGVSGTLGIPIHSVVLIDILGFEALVDAVGGIDVTVEERLPIGGDADGVGVTGWVEAGSHRLNGYEAAWFVRSRMSTSEDDRTRRQTILIREIATQLSPLMILRGASSLKDVDETHLMTDIPVSMLPELLIVRNSLDQESIDTLSLAETLGDLRDPDIDAVQDRVSKALS